jgi:predicted DNA-binding transcriptional regulator AlpA
MPPRTAAPAKVRYLTDVELAERLGLTAEAVRAWRKQGKGPDYLKVEGTKGTVRYPETWVDEWAESCRQRQRATA